MGLTFEVGQSSHDYKMLLSLRDFFGGGLVSPKVEEVDLESLKGIRSKSIFKLNKIDQVIRFFDSHLMLTDKRIDYMSFKSIWGIKQ